MTHLIDRVDLWMLNVERKKEEDLKRQNGNKERQMEGQRLER